MKIRVFLFLVFIPAIITAQYAHLKHIKPKFEFGVLVENTFVFNSKKTTKFINYENNETIISKGNSSNFYPFGFFISGRLNLFENLSFEFRLGIIFAGEPYAGLEYGFFLRYKFLHRKLFAVGGINLHDNFGAGHNSLSSTDETITEFGGSIGYQFTKSFAVILSYYKPSKELELYTENSNNFEESYSSYNLKYIIKYGIDITFNW